MRGPKVIPHRRGLALRRLAFLAAALVAGGLLNRYHPLPSMALRDVEDIYNTGRLKRVAQVEGPRSHERLWLAGNESVVVLCSPKWGYLRGWTAEEGRVSCAKAGKGRGLIVGQWEFQGTIYAYGRLTDPAAVSAQIFLRYGDRVEPGPEIGPEDWVRREEGRYFLCPVANMPDRGWRDQRPEPEIVTYGGNGTELGRWGVAWGGMYYSIP